MKMFWYNERTKEHDYIETPSDFTDYLPRNPAAINLYKLYIEHKNMKPIDAYVKVMEICVGRNVDE